MTLPWTRDRPQEYLESAGPNLARLSRQRRGAYLTSLQRIEIVNHSPTPTSSITV